MREFLKLTFTQNLLRKYWITARCSTTRFSSIFQRRFQFEYYSSDVHEPSLTRLGPAYELGWTDRAIFFGEPGRAGLRFFIGEPSRAELNLMHLGKNVFAT
jgi:hypothetical protein